jgi:hypothetical protein
MPTNTGHSRRCLAWVNGATIRRAATVADDARAALTCVNDGDYRLRGTNGLDTGEPGATRPVAGRRGVLRAHVGRLSHPCYGPA